MKLYSRNFILVFLLIISIKGFSQENDSDNKKAAIEKSREIKVSMTHLLGGIFAVEYEKLLTPYSSYGANMKINLNGDEEFEGYPYDFSLGSFFRYYFTETKEFGSKSFFAQASLNYHTGEYYDYDFLFDNEEKRKSYNAFGLGAVVGRKWINKRGFTLEAYIGATRTLFGGGNYPSNFFLGGVKFGFRF